MSESACSKISPNPWAPPLLAAAGALGLYAAKLAGSAACSTTSKTARPLNSPKKPRKTPQQRYEPRTGKSALSRAGEGVPQPVPEAPPRQDGSGFAIP